MSITVNFSLTPSPTATDGSVTAVIRNDTLLPVAGLSLPLAMTVSGSQLIGSFTDVLPQTSYTATATVTVSGIVSLPFDFLIANALVTPAGLWGTLTQLQGIYSTSNVNLWPVDALSNTPVDTLIQAAFNRADNWILQRLANQYCVPPAPGTSMIAQTLSYIECELAGVYLYEANGLQDATKGMDGKMQGHRDNAEMELKNLLYRNQGGFVRTAGYGDAPTFAAPTVTPFGQPVDPTPPYPIPVWSNYRWVWSNPSCSMQLNGGPYGWPVV